jgi:hypothetical protein
MDTVIVADPLRPDADAVIVAVPATTAVTRPELETVATAEAEEVQVKLAPEIAEPSLRAAVAVSWMVSPTDVSVALPGLTETLATVSTSVGLESLLVQLPRSIRAPTAARPRTVMAETLRMVRGSSLCIRRFLRLIMARPARSRHQPGGRLVKKTWE